MCSAGNVQVQKQGIRLAPTRVDGNNGWQQKWLTTPTTTTTMVDDNDYNKCHIIILGVSLFECLAWTKSFSQSNSAHSCPEGKGNASKETCRAAEGESLSSGNPTPAFQYTGGGRGAIYCRRSGSPTRFFIDLMCLIDWLYDWFID